MQNEDSVYLYDKNQGPLYENVLEDLGNKKCPHTHTVYALMDAEENEIPKNMMNHVSSCKECQKTVHLSQAVNGRINQLIPDFETTIPEILQTNIKSMLSRSEFSTSSRAKKGFRHFMKAVTENVLDILSVIFSVKMGLTYVAALLMGLLLQWIF